MSKQYKIIAVNLDQESLEITKQFENISAKIRNLLKEQNEGLKPLCLFCGGILYMVIGSPKVVCRNCNKHFLLKLDD